MSKGKPTLSDLASMMGRMGGQAGTGKAKARSTEQARKANGELATDERGWYVLPASGD